MVCSILEWCHVLFILITIRDRSFLRVLRFSSHLKKRGNVSKFQLGPHGNNNVTQSDLVIVICCKKRHASSKQNTRDVKSIFINSREYYYCRVQLHYRRKWRVEFEGDFLCVVESVSSPLCCFNLKYQSFSLLLTFTENTKTTTLC